MDEITATILSLSGCTGPTEELSGGLSDSRVFRVQHADGVAVLKYQKGRREFDFLTQYAPKTFGDAAWLPVVHAHGEYDSWNWIVLEYLPHEWPEPRRNTDAAALSILRELHATQVGPSDFDWADCEWTIEQLQICRRRLPDRTFETLRRIFDAYETRKSRHMTLCSGDPNCPNWLIRQDGQEVLIDWQIVTRANCALDLAGWIATLLPFEEMRKVARIYLGKTTSEKETQRLAKDIAVFFCRRCATNFWQAENSHNPEQWQAGLDYLQEALPDWIRQLAYDSELIKDH